MTLHINPDGRVVVSNVIPHTALMGASLCELALDLGCLDAPDFVPAGSTHWIESDYLGGFTASRRFWREWP